jgi:hypothetical protein
MPLQSPLQSFRLFWLSIRLPGKPAPDQLHLEAVASVGRFDQLTPGEQVEGAVQFIAGYPTGYSFKAPNRFVE